MMKETCKYAALIVIFAMLEDVAWAESNCSMTNPCADELGQGQVFQEPVQLRSNSTSLSVTLTVDIATLTFDWLMLKRRLYNNSASGPTITVKIGDYLSLDLVNNLGPENNERVADINLMNHPNSTNIHTHGLHISSELPQDDVLIPIVPQTHYQHIYHINSNNKPGTYWYHAHLHGCTAFQVKGGLAGMLIIEDPADEMPVELAAASCPDNCDKDIQLLFQPLLKFGEFTGFAGLQEMIADYDGFRNDRYIVPGGVTLTDWLADNVDYYLVNGQIQPTLTITTGQIYRFRMVNAGADASLELYITDSNGNPATDCDIREIALDGIYLPAPRTMYEGQSLLVPGNRVDWLVICNIPGIYQVTSFHNTENDLSIGAVEIYNKDLLTLNVSGEHANSVFPSTLPGNIANDDLTNVAEEDIPGRFVVQFDPKDNMNGMQWNGTGVYRYKMRLGEVQEWIILNTDKFETHQFHMHVNHFQVISYNAYTGGAGMNEQSDLGWYLADINDMNETCYYQREDYVPDLDDVVDPEDTLNSTLQYLGHDERFAADAGGTLGYSRLGDWRDTVNVPPLINITIRFVPTDFTGNVVIHCHTLEHTDAGMMMLVQIVNPDESTSGATVKSGDAYPGTCRKCDRYPPNNATTLCGTTNSSIAN